MRENEWGRKTGWGRGSRVCWRHCKFEHGGEKGGRNERKEGGWRVLDGGERNGPHLIVVEGGKGKRGKGDRGFAGATGGNQEGHCEDRNS